LLGDAGNDHLYGQNGNDQLLGGDGNDFLFGGLGDDELFGQAGNDFLFGDPGNDILVGGDGNDHLFGSTGRDLLIGGNGSDQLFGEAGDDVLIGGSTAFDEDPASLEALRAEMTSGNSFATRTNNLQLGGGANGSTTLDSGTVFDDGAVDQLFGDGGSDLFIVGNRDKVRDRTRNDSVVFI
jgi:Ca2+-binding RTX toxin-like protein